MGACRLEGNTMEEQTKEDLIREIESLQKRVIALETREVERQNEFTRLRETELHYKTLLENAPVGIFHANPDGAGSYVNAKLSELSGLTTETAQGVGWTSAIHPEDSERTFQSWMEYLAGKAPFEGVVRFVDPGGGLRWVMSHAAPVCGDDDRVIGHVGTLTDITELKLVQEELEKHRDHLNALVEERTEQLRNALDEKTVLLQEVHHRVKNNMQVMSSLIRMQAGGTQNHEVLDALHQTESRIASMALSHRLLYQSKDFSNINLREFTRTLYKNVFQIHSLNATEVLDDDIQDTSIPLDKATPLGLVLNEILTNVFKYAFPDEREGNIRISTLETETGWISILIKDNGIGIPADFDFDRCETLGLRMVRDIVTKQLDGEIAFQRNNGTEVRIKIPIGEAPLQTKPLERR